MTALCCVYMYVVFDQHPHLISIRGQIIASLGDMLKSELPGCLPIFVDRLKNEITRLTAVKALAQIARCGCVIILSVCVCVCLWCAAWLSIELGLVTLPRTNFRSPLKINISAILVSLLVLSIDSLHTYTHTCTCTCVHLHVYVYMCTSVHMST